MPSALKVIMFTDQVGSTEATEGRTRDGEGRKIRAGSGHVDRESQRHRGRARVLLKDLDFVAGRSRRRDHDAGSGPPRGQRGQRRPNRGDHLVRRIAVDADRKAGS